MLLYKHKMRRAIESGVKIVINVNKLKGRLVEKGYNQKDVASRWGIAQPSANLKLNGKRPMSLDEACALAKMLEIGALEFPDYFFANSIA